MRILLSNDDGVHAPGIRALYEELKKIGNVTVVAPLVEKSTTGHSLTIHKPLRLIPFEKNFYGVSGSPADSVYIGVREVLKGKPDLVVSGINRGANLGQDVFYSGTVSAAREGSIMGVPAIAVSLAVDFSKALPEEKLHYSTAAKWTVKFIQQLDMKRVFSHTLFNLNVPDVPMNKVKGLTWTRQGFRFYSGSVVKRVDHRGKPYFWVGGQYQGFKNEEGSDCFAVDEGYASVSPLKLDCTDFEVLGAGMRGECTKKRKK
jgi:5'-nucleotidase